MPHQFMSVDCKKCGEGFCPVCTNDACPKCGKIDITDSETQSNRNKMRRHMNQSVAGNSSKELSDETIDLGL